MTNTPLSFVPKVVGGLTNLPSCVRKGQCCNAALLVAVNTTLWLLHTVEALQIFYPNKQENFC